MILSQADVLEYYLRAQAGVQEIRVYDRTQDAVVLYDAERGSILRALAVFSFAKAEAMELVPEHTSRALNREFEDKLAIAIMRRCVSKLFLPAPITTALALLQSVKYIREGLSALWHGKLSVAVLDATAVTVSMARGDFATAGSVMFMLHLGEILEEWTHKKSVADLASAMSLRVDSVWQQINGTEVLPEDKAAFIRQEKEKGHTVIMVGDGVNDSPALSEADAGIAISTGAAIAREIADITVSSEDLFALVTLRRLGEALMERIHGSYRFIVGFNLTLIALGVAGVLPPATSALLHNGSTLGISLRNMTDLLDDEENPRK